MAVYSHPVIRVIPAGRQVGDDAAEFLALSDLNLVPDRPVRLPVAPHAFYGVRRLAGYTGPAIRVRRASDNAETDIAFAERGINLWALEAFRGTSTLHLVTLYDQSGNGFHATETNTANQCPVDLASLWSGQLPICFDGRSHGPLRRRSLSLPAQLTVDRANVTLALAVAPLASRQSGILAELGNGIGSALTIFRNASGSNDSLHSVAAGNSFVFGTKVLPCTPAFIGLTSSATERRIYLEDEISPAGAAAPSGTSAGGLIGATGFETFYMGKFDLFGYAVYARALTQAEMAAVKEAFREAFPVMAASGPPVVYEGDSIAESWGCNLNRGAQRHLVELLRKPVRLYNMGIYGTTVGSRRSAYAGGIAPLFAPGGILLLNVGRNDITNGRNATQILDDLTGYCTSARATGWRIVARTIAPNSGEANGTSAASLAVREAVNAGIRAGLGGLIDAVSDVAADPVLSAAGSFSNATIYADGLHQATGGYARMAVRDAAALETLL